MGCPKNPSKFTTYLVRRRSDGLAVGGFGHFGPPNDMVIVEFGYGLVRSARGAGLASEAVQLGLQHAAARGALIALADTELGNTPSQRVLEKNGLIEIERDAQKLNRRARRTLNWNTPAQRLATLIQKT